MLSQNVQYSHSSSYSKGAVMVMVIKMIRYPCKQKTNASYLSQVCTLPIRLCIDYMPCSIIKLTIQYYNPLDEFHYEVHVSFAFPSFCFRLDQSQ